MSEICNIKKKIEHLLGEDISHGLCPECLKKLYPDIADEVMKQLSS